MAEARGGDPHCEPPIKHYLAPPTLHHQRRIAQCYAWDVFEYIVHTALGRGNPVETPQVGGIIIARSDPWLCMTDFDYYIKFY